jgi:ATP-dependent Clp protease ATP-binding subunit ClpC
VWNALLQLLDDGRLTDGQGRTVNFRHAIIIMTSNVGTAFVTRSGALGFAGMRDPDEEADHKRIEEALKDTFRPEFLNRIDEIIIFEPLSKEDVVAIVDLQMKDVRNRLEDHGLEIELTFEAKEWLADQGYDEIFGARPLKRAIQRYVESPLSVQLLQEKFTKGDYVLVDVSDSELIFTRKEDASVESVDATASEDAPEDEAVETEEVDELVVSK